jgi:citrate lyase beta subunit
MKNRKTQRTKKLTKWFLDLEDGVALEKKDDTSKLVKETLLSTLANHLLENQNSACVSMDFEPKSGEAHGRPNKK